MVKTTGPLLSASASGTIGKTITHMRRNNRNVARRTVKPAQPRTEAQVGARAITAWLSTQWAQLSEPDKATWAAVSDDGKLSFFNAYQRENKRAWREVLAPSQFYPPTRSQQSGIWVDVRATGIPAAIELSFFSPVIQDNWGILIFRQNGGNFTATPQNLIGVCQHEAGPASRRSITDRDLLPHIYSYRLWPFSHDGNLAMTSFFREAQPIF